MSSPDGGTSGVGSVPRQEEAPQDTAGDSAELLQVTVTDKIGDNAIAVCAVPGDLSVGIVVVSALSADGKSLQPELKLSLEERAGIPVGWAWVSNATLTELKAGICSRLIIRRLTGIENARRYNTASIWLAVLTFCAAATVLGFAIHSMVASQPSGRHELADQLRPVQTAIAAASARGDIPSIQHDSQVFAADLDAAMHSEDSGLSDTDLASATGGFVSAILSGWIAIAAVRGRPKRG